MTLKESPRRHTLGPWTNNGGRIEADNAFTSYPRVIATVGTINEQSPTNTANARLIAAAPALLEALEALSQAVQATREGKRDGATFGRLSLADDDARAAIAQARGEEVTA